MNDAGFVERFAGLLADAGMPRMPARVFTVLLHTEPGAATAAELGERLQASAGAVSGAVNYLGRVGLLDRERLTGSRKDVYRVRPDVWFEAVLSQQPRYARWNAALTDGIAELEPDSAAARRLEQSRQFFSFLQVEMPALVERWHASQTSGTQNFAGTPGDTARENDPENDPENHPENHPENTSR